VNWVLLLEDVVGPVTVLEAEMEEVVNVPLLDTVEPPLGLSVTVDNEELGVLVVVEHEVVVIMLVVTVVVVAEPEEVVDAEAEVVVELAAELAEVGVQPGRVNVPL
jgi:hypothetical protein